MGETGSGKTTLAYLVARLYDPDEGAVCLDGVDMRELTLGTVACAVGFVTQDTYLFHDTVPPTCASPRRTPPTPRWWPRRGPRSIHDLIARLPEGYDTVVGARGYRFSGGERQRLAIARMLLRNPPRADSRRGDQRAGQQDRAGGAGGIDELARGRTTIAIAHRLSTVRHADQIVVLDRGRIVERGTHRALLERGGHYAAIAGALRS